MLILFNFTARRTSCKYFILLSQFGLSVYLFVTSVIHAKMAEPIKLILGTQLATVGIYIKGFGFLEIVIFLRNLAT